jgi:hypothetical protein
MPPRQRRRRRSDKHVNVFVQENAPKGREEIEDEDMLPGAVAGEGDEATGNKQLSVSRSRRLRAQRVARQTRARSEVFTRSIGSELRKLGVLSGGIVVILVVLSFVL